ncbi:photosystem I P700 apoprotein A2 [Cucumis melo var. makuwa]|uniref:Photosystem I P700 apoprotein A2 n=1 Tax=Cucumis melo var. makuwa TaxID=1194695 RepID=A0A5A7V3C2_CUCMM|nr:photosystem I P700 apoprotein A2 [Cucumis melo var. makuwa]TYK28775.1 photosystem I P700 apoprotein A2 [Cucumis melo var. makuwa]
MDSMTFRDGNCNSSITAPWKPLLFFRTSQTVLPFLNSALETRLAELFTGKWNLYAQDPDSNNHLFGTSEGAGTAILTLLGGFHQQTQSLWLTDMAHHHLAIAFIFLVAGHMYITNFGIGHSIKDLLEAHISSEGRLRRGHTSP